MARKIKKIIDEEGIDKREVGYYSTPEFIAEYITEELLKINPSGEFVLDPAVGKEELLKSFYLAGKEIDSYDIIDYQCYKYSKFLKQDFIEVYKNFKDQFFFDFKPHTKYDYIISNPPYNCHEINYIKENKNDLKQYFEVGTYNMYSMFLSAIIDMAKEGCLIGVIVSDSFLTSTYHSKLREKILKSCSIHQLILSPSNLFWSQKADVRTCILIMQKGTQYQKKVKVSNRPYDIDSFKEILKKRIFKEVELSTLTLKCGSQLLIDVDPTVIKLFECYPPLGTIYKCVTCISTGNDNKYLSEYCKKGFSIPFYKNPASKKFIAKEDCYLIDDFLSVKNSDKNFMVRNISLLGNEGIACSSMGLPFSAVYLPNNAVSGVNASIYPPSEDIDWLLSFLNSSLVTYLIRGVLIRSNMVTSGYVSNLPLITFSMKEKKLLSEISQKARCGIINTKEAINQIDNIIFSLNMFPQYVVEHIISFSNNLSKCV